MATALAALLLVAGTAEAEQRKLPAGEISAALSGKTAISTAGAPYRQYFDPNGVTLYLPDGGAIDPGKWRVDAGKQQYCSWWARGGWSCYDVFQTAEDENLWRSASGRDYPARLVEGRQLTP